MPTHKSIKCIVLQFIIFAVSFKGLNAQPRTIPSDYPTNTSVNYIRTWDVIKPITDPAVLTIASGLQTAKMTTAYMDGLGRPLQTVIKEGSLETISGAKKDIVSSVEYDQFGREAFKYLPAVSTASDGLFKLDPFQQQSTFMNAQYGAQGETYFYGQTNFEASPLNRVEKAMAPGNSWTGASRGVEMKYWINTATDDVKKWNVTDVTNGFGTYALSSPMSVYLAGTLYKNATVDEQGKQVIEFKDKEGKVILKKVQLTATADDGNGSSYSGWLCTYYIYDDLNNLRCVIQPEGVKTLSGNGWTLTSTILNEQCFRYEYDERNRMIMKKVPGAGEVWMVYDARDRLVLTQDATLRAQGKWMYTLYDNNFNRLTSSGLWSNSSDRLSHQSPASTNTAYPNLSGQTYEELTVSFYDNYNWLSTYGNPFPSSYSNSYDTYFQSASNTTWPYPQSNSQSAQLKGMVTGTRIKILGTSTYLYTISFYDDKSRVIQVQSTNISGGIDIVTTQYTWAGQPLVMVQKQQKSGSNAQTSVIVTQLTYDDLGRLVKTEKKLNNTLVNSNAMSSYKIIEQNEYDKLGQLKTKKLAPAFNSNAGLENLAYDYNIRGWMLGINRNYLATTGQNGTTKFGVELGYDKTTNSAGRNFATGQYNGNITGMIWKSDGDDVKRKYDFSYDAANRLLQGLFEQDDAASSWNSTTMNYTNKMGDGINATSAYDDNGNIKAMTQYGWKIGVTSSTPIDNLTYTMETGSNRLKQVTDANNDNLSKLGDFKYDPATKTSTDYSYDVNGNLVLDNNKKISSITYNHLNLPLVITVTDKGTITYTYDAVGNKLQKVVTEAGQPAKTTLYIGGAVYENDVLQFLSHEEGRIRFKPVNGATPASFEYDYFIKDHLGNVRMVLTEEQKQDKYPVASLEDAKVATEDDYYTIDNTKIVSASTVTNLPTYINDNGIGNNPSDPSFEQANSQKLYKLNSNTNKMGLSMTLKVMAGDKIDILGKSYWFDNNSGGSAVNVAPIVLDLLSGFIGAPGGATTGGHTTATELNGVSGVTNPVNSFVGDPGRDNPTYSQRPKAFINYLFFDEQFKYVSGGFSAVNSTPGLKNHFSELQNLAAQKNGYVYIYVSNESPVNVFFDNLQVVHTRSPILEETHYYPFGLSMSGISSKALNFGNPDNKAKFNSIEQNNDFDLNMYDAFYRNLDPQIGRFWQIDPKPNEHVSSYAAMLNNPIRFSDPLGDTTWVYNQNGILLGVNDDKLKNQVHFKHTEGDPGSQFSTKGMTQKQKNAQGREFRKHSFAFIGDKTLSDMRDIVNRSADSKVEIGFVGSVDKNKEIRLKELPITESNTIDGDKLMGKKINDIYSSVEQNNLLLDGHTHIKAYLQAQPAELRNYMRDGILPNQSPTKPEDYDPSLDRGNRPGVKGLHPSLIITHFGVTVYGSGSITPYGQPSPNNTYLNYKSLK